MKKIITLLTILLLVVFMVGCEKSINPTEQINEQSQHSILAKEAFDGCYTNLPSGLISWWKADGNAFDAEGGNNGNMYGGGGYLPGYLNAAFSFDGLNDYVEVPNNTSLDFGPGEDFSLSAWFKGPDQQSWQGTILSKLYVGNSLTKRNYGYSLMLRGPGSPNAAIYPQASWGQVGFWMGEAITGDKTPPFQLYSNCRYNDDMWHHVVATADRDGMAKLYVDGLIVNQADISSLESVNQASGTPFEIGRETTFSSYPFEGLLDEITVFNRALSSEEVTDIYEACDIIRPFEQCVGIDVIIDIKPGSFPNSVNCQDNDDNGVIPVAILTTEDFDATTVNHTTVMFGRNGAQEIHDMKKTDESKRHEEDVDGDGDIDLVFHFRSLLTGIECGDIVVWLTGETYSGDLITGSDNIQTVP